MIEGAEGAFNGHAHFWSAKGSTRKQRAQLLERSACKYGHGAADTWKVSVDDQRMLRAVQLRCYSKVIHFAREAGEDDESFYHRRNTCIRDLRKSLNAPTWDKVVMGRLHDWAGHLARIRNYDSSRLTLQVLDFKGTMQLDALSFLTGSRGHNSRFHAWRWEAQFHRFWTWTPLGRIQPEVTNGTRQGHVGLPTDATLGE